jgi:hypothetical protein
LLNTNIQQTSIIIIVIIIINYLLILNNYLINIRSDELSLNVGNRVKVLEKFKDNWWQIALIDDLNQTKQVGLYPSNYLQEENTSINNNYQNISLISKSKSSHTHNSFNNKALISTDKLSLNNIIDNSSSSSNMIIGQHYPHHHHHHHSQTKQCESISSTDRDVEYVRVVSTYKSRKTHELNVKQNEILKVIDDDLDEKLFMNNNNEKLWIKVFNSEAETGYIPSTCVEPILDNDLENFVFIRRPAKSGKFANQNWYYGKISRFDSIILLNKYANNGDFLIRDSDVSIILF